MEPKIEEIISSLKKGNFIDGPIASASISAHDQLGWCWRGVKAAYPLGDTKVALVAYTSV